MEWACQYSHATKHEPACPRNHQTQTRCSRSRSAEMKPKKPASISGGLVTIPVEIGRVRTDQPAREISRLALLREGFDEALGIVVVAVLVCGGGGGCGNNMSASTH